MNTSIKTHKCGIFCGPATAMAGMFILTGYLVADASAALEEIQVYLDDFAEVGKPGLDLHANMGI